MMINTADKLRLPRASRRRRPINLQDWLVAGYVICLPVQIGLSETLRFAPSDVLLIAIALGYLLGFARIRHLRTAWSVWHVGLLLSILLSTVTALVRTGEVTQYALVNKTLGLLMLFLGYVVLVSESWEWQRIRRLLRLLILSTGLLNLASIGAFVAMILTGISIPLLNVSPLNPRLAGLLIDPNAYGGLLVVVLSLHMLTYRTDGALVRGRLGLPIAVSLAIGVLLTYSRSSWVGLGLLVLMLMIMRPKSAFTLAGIGAVGFAVVVKALGPQYYYGMGELAGRHAQIEARFDLMDKAFAMFRDSPLVGAGLGVFADRFDQIVHNTAIWILTECGIVGLLFFVGFLAWFVQRGLRGYRVALWRDKPLILGLVAANVAMIGLSMGIEALYQRHWWLVLAMTASATSLAARDRRVFVSAIVLLLAEKQSRVGPSRANERRMEAQQ